MEITTIGLDLAKNVFQVHAVDAAGDVVVRKTLRRAQLLPFFAKTGPCLVGIEACGTSHHWARELTALGHEVRLMPPAYVKPYVKRGKNDAVDAEAICEAVTRPTMRYVAVKSREQQAALTLHRSRSLLVGQRTQLINMIRSLLAEFGVVIPKGRDRALIMARQIVDSERAPEVPDDAAMKSRGASRRSLVSARSAQRLWLRWSATLTNSVRAGSSPPAHAAAEVERREGAARVDQQDGEHAHELPRKIGPVERMGEEAAKHRDNSVQRRHRHPASCCSTGSRRASSALAVSGGRSRKATTCATARIQLRCVAVEKRRIGMPSIRPLRSVTAGSTDLGLYIARLLK